jgi:hypothetical protein
MSTLGGPPPARAPASARESSSQTGFGGRQSFEVMDLRRTDRNRCRPAASTRPRSKRRAATGRRRSVDLLGEGRARAGGATAAEAPERRSHAHWSQAEHIPTDAIVAAAAMIVPFAPTASPTGNPSQLGDAPAVHRERTIQPGMAAPSSRLKRSLRGSPTR